MTPRRLAHLVVHNWPLKLGAVAVATLLYAGLVLGQNAQRWEGQVAIQPRNIPSSAVLVSAIGSITEIRYFAPSDVAARVSSDTFSASVDLSSVDPNGGPTLVPVSVKAADDRITVVDFQPLQVRVELDPLVQRTVPVRVDRGDIPPGLQVGVPDLSATTVTAVGPESVVKRVSDAVARVVIQPGGLGIDQDVSLVAVDAVGNTLTPVDLRPDSVHVKIRVGSNAETRSLPVNPVVTGTPANGYVILAVKVEPAIVTITGDAATLEALDKADTAPVSIANATADVAATVPLALPTDASPVGVKNVTVTVTIRPLTGARTFSAGIVLAGARDDRTYTLSTDSVNVTLGGSLAALDKLDPASFTVTADVSALAAGNHSVQLNVNLPAGLTVNAISPPQVGVVVAPAASPSPSTSPSPTPGPS
ncbi:MAG TPA: CdaR family protein [Candidatus Dormibacteraeota bacterium]|nr:CdaR family protein [Candidatus Dormibacteraeota bacterium]